MVLTVKNLIILSAVCLIANSLVFSPASANEYVRSDFNFKSYKSNVSEGFYTGRLCNAIDVDHVVSLKDAFENGAAFWSSDQKRQFANDRENHAPSCAGVNRSKGSSKPVDFFRKSSDGKGKDYQIIRRCGYLQKYYDTKRKYGLSFKDNRMSLFTACGIH